MRNLILSALLLASAFQTALGEQDGQWIYIVEDGGATITAWGGGEYETITIPSELGGYAVKKVGNGIGEWGYPCIFYSPAVAATIVTSITIPDSVTSIGDSAFAFCSGLTTLTIGSGVTSIGNNAFQDCSGLTGALTIPNSVTSIGNSAFARCSGLTSITIPNSVTSIGGNAFFGCSGLTGTLTIPNSVTSIGPSAFYGCSGLTTLTIGSGVTSIQDIVFAFCSGLTSITIPSSVTSIGNYAFGRCSGLTSITIPNSVTSIGSGAFDSAAILQRVFLPARFGTTYQNFSLRSAQVILYDASNLAPIYLAGQQSVVADPNTQNLYTSVQYSDNYTAGQTAGRSEVTSFPSSYNLYTATQYGNNYNAGQQNVISNPNTHNLYTTSQIQNMAVGDLVLTREVNGNFVLNYDIEQSDDLANWTVYSANRQIVKLPADKAFVRIKAKQ